MYLVQWMFDSPHHVLYMHKARSRDHEMSAIVERLKQPNTEKISFTWFHFKDEMKVTRRQNYV